MTKGDLVKLSLLADVLDVLVVGQIPVLSWVIDIPIIALHVAYAGVAGLTTLLELIPFVGIVPFFTIAAFMYDAND